MTTPHKKTLLNQFYNLIIYHNLHPLFKVFILLFIFSSHYLMGLFTLVLYMFILVLTIVHFYFILLLYVCMPTVHTFVICLYAYCTYFVICLYAYCTYFCYMYVCLLYILCYMKVCFGIIRNNWFANKKAHFYC